MVRQTASAPRKGKTLPGGPLGKTLVNDDDEEENGSNDQDNFEEEGGNEEIRESRSGEESEGEDAQEEEDRRERRKRGHEGLIAEEADEEEEDEEDGEDGSNARQQEQNRSRKSQKKAARNPYIDDIAQVDEEDEPENDDDDGQDIIDDSEEQRGQRKSELEEARREATQRAKMREEQQQAEEDLDPEEIEEYYRRRGQMAEVESRPGGAISLSSAEQASLLPSLKDPRLFSVSVNRGKEREVVLCLLQKKVTFAKQGQPLPVFSAVAQDYLSGKVYVEAYKEDHIKSALSSIRHVHFRQPFKVVPTKEMPAAVAVAKEGGDIVAGSWVRVKRGTYKDDLAKVLSVSGTDGKAMLQLVPRLDLELLSKSETAAERRADEQKRGRAPQKLFRAQEARDNMLEVVDDVTDTNNILGDTALAGETFTVLQGKHKFVDGYQIKENVAPSSIKHVPDPPLDEIQRWAGGGNLEASTAEGIAKVSELMPAEAKAKATNFSGGDPVTVIDSDLKNMRGLVDTVTPHSSIRVSGLHDPSDNRKIHETLEFLPSQLRKAFKEGDQVRVMAGQHKGETGMVSSISTDVCTIFTDVERSEVQVFIRDVSSSSEVSGNTESLGEFSLFDLVGLAGNVAGIIIKVENDSVRVLTTGGRPSSPEVRTCRLPDLKMKLNGRSSAPDIGFKPIRVDAMVEVAHDELRGEQATVLHVHRGNLFARVKGRHSNGGIVCISAKKCRCHGAIAAAMSSSPAPSPAQSMPDGRTSAGTFSAPSVPQSPRNYNSGLALTLQSPRAQNAPASMVQGTSAYANRQRQTNTDKDVRIKSGVYKRYKGKIKDTTDTHARVELEASSKVVTLKLSELDFQGNTANGEGTSGHGELQTRPHMGTAMSFGSMPTPSTSAKTPGRGEGSMTPMQGALTPGQGEMSAFTPGRQPGGGGMGTFQPGLAMNSPLHDSNSLAGPMMGQGGSKVSDGSQLTKGESVKVLEGTHAGKSGSVFGIDNQDIVVQMDDEYEVIDASMLAKV